MYVQYVAGSSEKVSSYAGKPVVWLRISLTGRKEHEEGKILEVLIVNYPTPHDEGETGAGSPDGEDD